MKSFNNITAVITGAGSGIGQALAKALSQQGAHLALADINEAGLKDTLSQLATHSPSSTTLAHSTNIAQRATTHIVDVSDWNQMQAFAQQVADEHGSVNLVINNAGITLQKFFANHSIEDWQRIIGINLWGVIHGCKAFLPYLRDAEHAHIVNMSSMAGYFGFPSQSSYCATKSATKALSECLWTELAMENIGVTSVHPGAVRTNIIRATLEDSDDLAVAKRNLSLTQKYGMDVDKAAAKILRAVEKNKMRVRVGADSVFLDVIKRCFPVFAHRVMLAVLKHA